MGKGKIEVKKHGGMRKSNILFSIAAITIQALIFYTFVLLPIKIFILCPIKAVGCCMFPTMPVSSTVLLNKTAYWFTSPKRGDIISFRIKNFDQCIMKRVVGLPGETIEIYNNMVYVNGKELEEPYVFTSTYGEYGPVTIPENHVFVMGDNRGNSIDSRTEEIGTVPVEKIEGKALCCILSLNKVKLLVTEEVKTYND